MKIQKIIYTRHGQCEPDKCGGACCKLLTSERDKETFKPTKGICKYLKDGKCIIQNKKPKECSDFPNSPNHPIYKKVEGVCTYWFDRIVEEIDE